MRIALTNIREHRERELTFPERGLVQLAGASGAGKSSVLDAVAFALYDNRRSLKTFHQRQCRVELAGFGLDVVRSKGPSRLSVGALEGDAAQGEIERRLDMGAAEFMASSYIVQDLDASLLAMPAAEQLRLVQSLVARGEEPERVKSALKERARQRELTAAGVQGELRALRALAVERLAELARMAPSDLVQVERQLAAVMAEAAAVKVQLLAVLDRLGRPARAKAAQRDALARRVAELAGRNGPGPTVLAAALAAADRAATEAATELAEATQRMMELEFAQKARPCPVCAAPLVLTDGCLVRGRDAPADAAERLATLRRQVAALGGTLKARQDERTSRSLALAQERGARTELVAGRVQLEALTRELGDDDTPAAAAALEAERARLTRQLEAAEQRHAGLMAKEAQARRRAQAEAAGRELAAKIAAATAVLGGLSRELAVTARLRELSDQAAADAVGVVLSTLNINAQRYVELLFPDTGTSVALLNEKTLVNGEKRPCLATRIIHKGCPYDSLRELSGGERSRVCLAFQLALCHMYRSPILMIDEGMTGLSPAEKLLCFAALREVAESRLVIVVEHGAPASVFDEVVDVAAPRSEGAGAAAPGPSGLLALGRAPPAGLRRRVGDAGL